MPKNELISLSLVAKRPMHVYALKEVVRHTGLDEWGRISSASIYNTLARLQKEGAVRVSMQKAGNMPERKVYSISEQGRKRLKKEMKEALLMIGAGDQPLHMAMTFGMGMSAREIIACLRERIRLLQEGEAYVKQNYSHLRQYDIYNGMIMTEAARKHMRIEIETARKFIRMLEKEPDYYFRMARQLEEAEGHDDNDEMKTRRRKK